MITRRSLALGCLSLAQLRPAFAQEWPTRPIRLVVTFPPGGASDIVARLLADFMTPRLGQRVMVDNRPGAGGTLAAAHVAQQPADGTVLMLSNTAPIVTSPPLYANPGYDPVRSFTHVAHIGATPMVVVGNAGIPARDMAGLVAWLRAQPNPVAYGSSGVGSVGHVTGAMFSAQSGIPLVHAPYRGSQPMQADLLGGAIMLSFDPLPDNVEGIRAGRLRGFAVTAGERQPSLPDVPAVAEVGLPALVAGNWLGLAAPAGLPAPLAARLHGEVAAALADPAFAARLATVGIRPEAMSAEAHQAFVAEQVRVVGGTVRALGLRNE